MSDRYHYVLDFWLRRDTPAPLVSSLRALTGGGVPDEADLSALPPLVASYFRSGDFVGGALPAITTRLQPSGMTFRAESPGDAVWLLHYERVFHDDEFWNGGMYLIWWLFQFAARQGHLATMRMEFDAPPEIFTLIGDDVVATRLGYNPETHQALDYREAPLDPENPIVVAETRRTGLREMLDGIAFMAEIDG